MKPSVVYNPYKKKRYLAMSDRGPVSKYHNPSTTRSKKVFGKTSRRKSSRNRKRKVMKSMCFPSDNSLVSTDRTNSVARVKEVSRSKKKIRNDSKTKFFSSINPSNNFIKRVCSIEIKRRRERNTNIQKSPPLINLLGANILNSVQKNELVKKTKNYSHLTPRTFSISNIISGIQKKMKSKLHLELSKKKQEIFSKTSFGDKRKSKNFFFKTSFSKQYANPRAWFRIGRKRYRPNKFKYRKFQTFFKKMHKR